MYLQKGEISIETYTYVHLAKLEKGILSLKGIPSFLYKDGCSEESQIRYLFERLKESQLSFSAIIDLAENIANVESRQF